jgi:hypothetical protein
MNKASRVKGIAAIDTIMIATLIEVGSYDELNRGRNGMGNSAKIQIIPITVKSFHLFFARAMKNEENDVFVGIFAGESMAT